MSNQAESTPKRDTVPTRIDRDQWVTLKLRAIHRRLPLQTVLREALDIGLAATGDRPEGGAETSINSPLVSGAGT